MKILFFFLLLKKVYIGAISNHETFSSLTEKKEKKNTYEVGSNYKIKHRLSIFGNIYIHIYIRVYAYFAQFIHKSHNFQANNGCTFPSSQHCENRF